MLERTEARHLGAAARLRRMGLEEPARRAEQFAAWARFDLDEPQEAQRLYAVSGELRQLSGLHLLYSRILEGALSLGGADRGNLQLVNQATGALLIVAEHGFRSEFLEYFAVVDDDGSACGRAAKRGVQTVIADVTTDPGFAPHRAIAAASGFRAVVSTPLTGRDGRLIGMVSTHYRQPYGPLGRDRQVMTRYGQLAGWAVAEHQRLAEFHRAAAAADRQRAEQAEEAESRAVAPLPTEVEPESFQASLLESRALRRTSEEARAHAQATRERISRDRSQREISHEPASARRQARMATMPVIEQAKGIVMVQQECGPEDAFDLLCGMSQRTGVKVHALAAQIVKQVASRNNGGDATTISLGAMRYLPSGTRERAPAVEAD